MTDEKGPDEKIICVPLNDPSWGRSQRHPRRPGRPPERDRALLPGLQGPRARGKSGHARLRQPRRGRGHVRRGEETRRRDRLLAPAIARGCAVLSVRPADVAQLVEHFTRNEGVHRFESRASASEICRSFLAKCRLFRLRPNTSRTPTEHFWPLSLGVTPTSCRNHWHESRRREDIAEHDHDFGRFGSGSSVARRAHPAGIRLAWAAGRSELRPD